MANTGVRFGGDIMLYQNTGTEAVPVWTPFAHATSHGYKGTTEMRTRVHKDDGGASGTRPGRHAPGTITIAGLSTYDGVDFFGLEAIRQARTRIQVKYSGRPTGDTDAVENVESAGDKYLEGFGYVSEVGEEAPVDGDATYSATITLDGLPTEKEVPAA